MIPADAQKPGDPRIIKKQPCQYSLLSDLTEIIKATTLPMPINNPASILDIVTDKRLQIHYESELAYLRGDFEQIKQLYHKTEGDDASRIRASSITIAAAISTGDYPLFLKIESYLRGFIKTNDKDGLSAFAELSLSTAFVSAFVLNMVPDWIKDGDFSVLTPQMKPDAIYKRVRYLQYSGQLDSAFVAAQTALDFCDSKYGITIFSLYFRAVCAMVCCTLGRFEEAKRRLTDVLKIALPHGLITPFAESVTSFGGVLEWCLKQEYPEYYDAVIRQWESTFVNWRIFHNRFAKDKITLVLPLREYQIAQLAARGVSRAKIAEQFHLSPGTVKNSMSVIYETLLITGHDRENELAKYIF
jgi:hypothetical protein